ncbi:hypothetical protein C8J57DRAFT_1366432 [Mycena rebaudengoi]|nr:hypothetical protein C8J57DRAFT_1366432 [Mycena rebaudengoi]
MNPLVPPLCRSDAQTSVMPPLSGDKSRHRRVFTPSHRHIASKIRESALLTASAIYPPFWTSGTSPLPLRHRQSRKRQKIGIDLDLNVGAADAHVDVKLDLNLLAESLSSSSSDPSLSFSSPASSSISLSTTSSSSASASSSSAASSLRSSSQSTSNSRSVPSSSLPVSSSVSSSPPASSSASSIFMSVISSHSSFPISSSSSRSSSFTISSSSSSTSSPESSMGGYIVTNTPTSATGTSTGVLGTSTGSSTPFSHNVGGIIAVAISSVVALILGVVIIFFACTRYKRKRGMHSAQSPTQQMRERGAWRSPLEADNESMENNSAGYISTAGHGRTSAEGSGEGTSEGNLVGSSHGHLGFTQAGATLAAGIDPSTGHWESDYPAPGPSSHGHSSQSTSHGHGSSQLSHGHSAQLPPSPTAGSASAHVPGSASSHHSRLMLPTPPSSDSNATHDESAKGFFARLRSGRNSAQQVAFDPAALRDPTSPRAARPSSLLNPPLPADYLRGGASAGGSGGAEWHGWKPTAAQPLPSPALSEDPRTPEGLLRPGLAVLLPPTHSTRTLGDHVDYSRPIGARINARMESGNTFASASSEGDAVIYR